MPRQKKNYLLVTKRQQRRLTANFLQDGANQVNLIHELVTDSFPETVTSNSQLFSGPCSVQMDISSSELSYSRSENIDVASNTTFLDRQRQCIDHIGGHLEQEVHDLGCDYTGHLGQETSDLVCDQPGSSINHSSLLDDLRLWAVESLLSHIHLNKLLQILIKHGHQGLPKDSRTLLQTPREEKNIVILDPGYYYHFGVENSLINSLSTYFDKDIPNSVELNINIDGLPISKSSGSQLWPILGQICSKKYIEPFPIGVYHGLKKPSDHNEFLKHFVEEMQTIKNKGGIDFHDLKVQVFIKGIVCDSPARAFISGVKGHNAYFGCHKCIQEGDYCYNRMTFPEINATLRTDESFSRRLQEEHHKAPSVLETLGIGMVSQLPLDYMHLICLGVVKKLLQLWTKGPRDVRMNSGQITIVSDSLCSFSKFISKEFKRKPRSLTEVDRWKATEFRQFLFYTGPIVLKKNLPTNRYIHFLCLHVAVRILASETLHLNLNAYAQSLLECFVKNFATLYGAENVTYNLHNLVHICQDVRIHGPLDSFSAFPFENYLQKLKLKTHTGYRPLHQIINRITEQNSILLGQKDVKRNLTIGDSGKYIKVFQDILLSTKSPDNVCMLKNSSIMIIESVLTIHDNVHIKGNIYNNFKPLYEEPCNSTHINIKTIDTNYKIEILTIPITEVESKCIMLPMNSSERAILPIIHTST